MAIKISNTTVINDSRALENITNLKTVGGQSILGSGDIATGGGVPVGGIIRASSEISAATLGSDWLEANGSVYSQAAYPALYTKVGLLDKDVFNINTGLAALTTSYMYDIAYSGSKYVLASTNGTMYVSTNLSTWSVSSGVSGVRTLAYASGSGKFIGINSSNYAVSSASGDSGTWVQSSNALTSTAYSSTYNSSSNRYFTTYLESSGYPSYTNVPKVAYTDGTSWTITDAPSSPGANNSAVVANNNTVVYYASNYGNNMVLYSSTDGGNNWTARTAPFISMNNIKILVANNRFFATSNGNSAYTSTDLTTWSAFSLPTTTEISSVAYGNGRYGFAGSGGSGVLATSTDLSTFSMSTPGGTLTSMSVVRFVGSVFAVGKPGAGALLTSTDLTTVKSAAGYNYLTEFKLPNANIVSNSYSSPAPLVGMNVKSYIKAF